MSADGARRNQLDPLALSTLLLCCTLWGLNQVATKVALVDVPPVTQAALRSAGAALLVLAWASWRRVPLWRRDGSLRAGLLAGALFGAEFACIFVGLQFTTASRMVVFIYLAPFVVALGMPFIAAAERLRPLQWAGLLAAFGGVALAFAEGFAGISGTAPSGAQQACATALGDALGVLAALLWGATTLVIRGSRLAALAPEKTLLYQLVVSALLLAVAAPLAGEAWPANPSTLSIASILFQTVVITFASYLAWFWLVRHYAATTISSFTLLTPVSGLVFGVFLLNEPMTWRLLLALLAVGAGLLLVNRR
jgi:drug/metabolite transporter (DMT)-like permease